MGVLRLPELAGVKGVTALVAGTSDLVRDLRARSRPDRANLLYALSAIVTCARAYGLAALDGVHLDLSDEAGLRDACRQGRDLGFDGKTLIHPAQVAVANETFGPDAADVARAAGLLAAWQAARLEGRGVAVFESRLVEHLHASEARELLEVAASLGLEPPDQGP